MSGTTNQSPSFIMERIQCTGEYPGLAGWETLKGQFSPNYKETFFCFYMTFLTKVEFRNPG